jgi:hypothetical protein
MLRERAVTFVWRCPECSTVYDGESLLFLYADGFYSYCSCGGRLVEDVEPERERRYRLVIPGSLVGSRLHRQLEMREEGEIVEVAVGELEDGYIHLCNCDT